MKKTIIWPFWLQLPTIALIPFVLTLIAPADFMFDSWIFWRIYNEYSNLIISIQWLLCLPVGIIGLVLNRRMKKFRVAAIILSAVNLTETLLGILYFLLLWMVVSNGFQ